MTHDERSRVQDQVGSRPAAENAYVDGSTLVERLVAGGTSRLTAERIAAIRRGDAEPGRARLHPQSRR